MAATDTLYIAVQLHHMHSSKVHAITLLFKDFKLQIFNCETKNYYKAELILTRLIILN